MRVFFFDLYHGRAIGRASFSVSEMMMVGHYLLKKFWRCWCYERICLINAVLAACLIQFAVLGHFSKISTSCDATALFREEAIIVEGYHALLCNVVSRTHYPIVHNDCLCEGSLIALSTQVQFGIGCCLLIFRLSFLGTFISLWHRRCSTSFLVYFHAFRFRVKKSCLYRLWQKHIDGWRIVSAFFLFMRFYF